MPAAKTPEKAKHMSKKEGIAKKKKRSELKQEKDRYPYFIPQNLKAALSLHQRVKDAVTNVIIPNTMGVLCFGTYSKRDLH